MDMLVALYKLEGVEKRLQAVRAHDITIRRAMEADAAGWAGECAVALSSVPATCHIATRDGEVVGFACHDATAKGFFGPTGTDERVRGLGVGAALLVASLAAMREAGYAYAVIGAAGDHVKGFYEKVVGAVEIAGSVPGLYSDLLNQ